jgi:cardiolipin synthase
MAEDETSAGEFRDAPPFVVHAQGHSFIFYPGGPDRLEALLGLIDGARHQLCLSFYIFARDESGTRVRDALVSAARRGVDVRVIVDGFGALAEETFFAPLIEAGGSFCRFAPRWSRRYLIRNHQKIVVADGKRAMLGGFNVENSYFVPSAENSWNDLAFTVEGPVVARIAAWFAELEDWAMRPDAQFLAIKRKVSQWHAGDGPVQLLIGGPTRGLSSWAREVGLDLRQGDRLDMIMAYFSPAPRLLKRLRAIARKGQVRLLFPAKSDNSATIGAARALYGSLLRSGARIWEFQPCRLHTKLIVLDDASYLGSANFDMRSLFLNLEIVLKVEDAALARRLREYFAYHLPACREITREFYDARATFFKRLLWRLSWFLVTVVDYTVSRRLNFAESKDWLRDDGGEGAGA